MPIKTEADCSIVVVPTGPANCDVLFNCGILEPEAVEGGELPTLMRLFVSAVSLVPTLLLIVAVSSLEAVPMFDEGVDEDVIMSTLC